MNSVATWPSMAERWLDARGRGAWIATMVIGFILFWPIGLALLFYMIWSKRMSPSLGRCGHSRRHRGDALWQPTGNSAFDSYRQETIRRLEDEQQAFQAFLDRLRAAKDKTEFDQFMEERARNIRGDDTPDAGQNIGQNTGQAAPGDTPATGA